MHVKGSSLKSPDTAVSHARLNQLLRFWTALELFVTFVTGADYHRRYHDSLSADGRGRYSVAVGSIRKGAACRG